MVFGMPRVLFRCWPGPASVRSRARRLLFAAASVGAVIAALTSGWSTGRPPGPGDHRRRHRVGLAIAGFGLVGDRVVAALLLLAIAGGADVVSRCSDRRSCKPRCGRAPRAAQRDPHHGGRRRAATRRSRRRPRRRRDLADFSVVSGGLMCVVGVVALAVAMPEFARYRRGSRRRHRVKISELTRVVGCARWPPHGGYSATPLPRSWASKRRDRRGRRAPPGFERVLKPLPPTSNPHAGARQVGRDRVLRDRERELARFRSWRARCNRRRALGRVAEEDELHRDGPHVRSGAGDRSRRGLVDNKVCAIDERGRAAIRRAGLRPSRPLTCVWPVRPGQLADVVGRALRRGRVRSTGPRGELQRDAACFGADGVRTSRDPDPRADAVGLCRRGRPIRGSATG